MAASKSSTQKSLTEIIEKSKQTINVMDNLDNLGLAFTPKAASNPENDTMDKVEVASENKSPKRKNTAKKNTKQTTEQTIDRTTDKAIDKANNKTTDRAKKKENSSPVPNVVSNEQTQKESLLSILHAPQKQLKNIKLTLLITQKAKDNADRLYKEMGYRSVNDFVNSLLENIDTYLE